MTLTKQVAAESLHALDLRRGDVLRVLADEGPTAVVQIERADDSLPDGMAPGAITSWLKAARGSVCLPADESADDARMKYYEQKYGPEMTK